MKIKKIISAALSAALCAGVMTACGESKNVQVQTETAAETTAKAELPEEKLTPYDEMVSKAFVSSGNTYRLKKKLEKIRSGEKSAVAFIGGSITEGYTVQPDECYAKLTYDFIAGEHTDTVEYINAGISGTPSILGNVRLERDVLSHSPDIIFVEFAVNDGSENMFKESYDSLVKTALTHENEPAVVLLFNRTKEGHTAQDYMKQIGEYYELPMISTADAFTYGMDNSIITWEDNYNDSSHPSPEGHKFFLELIAYCFEQFEKEGTDNPDYIVKPLGKHSAPYANAVLAEADYDNSNENLQINEIGSFDKAAGDLSGFRKGWAFNAESDGSPFKFTVNANALFLVCNRKNSDAMGKIDVFINGEKAKTINLNDPDGWGDPYAYQVIKWQSVKTMEVEVRAAEGYEDKLIEILGIAYSINDPITF